MKFSPHTPDSTLSRMPQQTMILIIRSVHGLITMYFLACIVSIYYAGLTNQINLWAYLAAASLLIETMIVVLNRGDCPLGVVHRKFGDQKTFFELFLPQPIAKKAVPVLGIIATVGFLLLLF